MSRSIEVSSSLKHVRPWGVHLGRVVLLGMILVVMHLQHQKLEQLSRSQHLQPIGLNLIQRYFPSAARWDTLKTNGRQEVLSNNGERLGYVIQTAPDSDRFLGFSGPSNLFLAFNNEDRILGIELLTSRDTRDHVELIRKNKSFLSSWIGLSWKEAAERREIDGVSGATLTSMAMVQGIQRRLGASQLVSKFPQPLELPDVKQLYPDADSISQDTQIPSLWHVHDKSKNLCGLLLRTSPSADDIIGYQGPTETRIAFSIDGKISSVQVIKSFDNEPYVGHVQSDFGFAALLSQFNLEQWSEIDLKKEGIEGVSGATMTSMAVAEGIKKAIQEYETKKREATSSRDAWQSNIYRHSGTLLMIAAGLVIGLTSLRGHAVIRVGFQILLVVYMGIINADLLSLAMFQGWVRSGVPWQNAIGLVVLAIAAVSLPIVARTNVYCSHLCPHGALQQLTPRRWKIKQPISQRLLRWLHWIRPVLLAWVLIVTMLQLPFSLVDIEPFDAYSWRAATWPTIAVALVGIIASMKVPMAYCRFGCPTGSILNYLRRHSRSDRFTKLDLFAAGCLLCSLCLYLLR